MSTILQVDGLQVHYGVIEAVKGIDFMLAQGEITTLLGANGAGKSTTLLALSGLLKPTAGSIHFDDVEVSQLVPHEIVARGLVQAPEGREILTTLTVKENLLLGAIGVNIGMKSRQISTGCSPCFRAWPRGSTAWRVTFRAASNRC
jgi:branched-chain amino acid transport system ATP-binding protein